ncbi:unnamed protein product [Symbiodinium sp. CCMP2592]|nr:unnamed protein product [Symbiodinium sp. CCMP2592]
MSANGLQTRLGAPSEPPEAKLDASEAPSESSESNASRDVFNPFWETYIQILASMQPTRPEIVRGIPVCQALQHTPRMWARGDLDALHVYSRATLELDEFWSHSWRTPGWLKYISILVLHNSFPAFVVGTLLASASFALCAADILPMWSSDRFEATGWSVLTGTLSYYLTLLLWRRGKLAFLDVACINQVDDQLKTEGLVSMGAILKRSKSLLVLWDSSYTSRLWCMFEMAAFLHSKGPTADERRHLVVCPVFVGPTLLLGNLGLSLLLLAVEVTQLPIVPWGAMIICGLFFPCFTVLAYVVLEHCRSIDVVQKQVRCFTIQQALCHCCSSGHIDPYTGEPSMCDRSILIRCISSWFGSPEQFESLVRHHVMTILVHQLANNVFSYWRVVQILSPLFWFFLDISLWRVAEQRVPVQLMLSAVSYWMMLMPSIVLILLRLAYKFRNLATGTRQQLMLSVGLVAIGVLLFATMLTADRAIVGLSWHLWRDQTPGSVTVLILSSTLSVLLWSCLPLIDTHIAHPGMQ